MPASGPANDLSAEDACSKGTSRDMGSDSGRFDDMLTADSCLHVDGCDCHGAVCCMQDPEVSNRSTMH